jgi:hypothetical protein
VYRLSFQTGILYTNHNAAAWQRSSPCTRVSAAGGWLSPLTFTRLDLKHELLVRSNDAEELTIETSLSSTMNWDASNVFTAGVTCWQTCSTVCDKSLHAHCSRWSSTLTSRLLRRRASLYTVSVSV